MKDILAALLFLVGVWFLTEPESLGRHFAKFFDATQDAGRAVLQEHER